MFEPEKRYLVSKNNGVDQKEQFNEKYIVRF